MTPRTMTRRFSALVSGAAMVTTLACDAAPPPRPPEGADQSYLPVIPLTNEEFSIIEMATAHGAFTIEVEVDVGADADSIARRLVEPVRDRYAEVLVYFYDRAGEGLLPLSRVQWTSEQGYTRIDY